MIKYIIGLALGIAMVWVGVVGINRQERHECLQWQAQAVEFQRMGWYATDWQSVQCRTYGIELPTGEK